jgi:epoxyqueuosine reductase
MNQKDQIKDYARTRLGVDLIGFCRAEKLEAPATDLRKFVEKGYQGDMKYLEDTELRTDPRRLLPGARAVIVIALNYHRRKPSTPPGQGRVSRYAWGRDYHKIFKKVLRDLQKYLDQNWPGFQHRICTDSAPLLEKAYAAEAGLGFYGKNTLLINPRLGSFVLLGEILTTMELEPDAPRAGSCGTCTRCQVACPTKALAVPGQIDARRCISYLTVESKNPFPDDLAPALDNQIFGCDICQEVCPYNLQFAPDLPNPWFGEKQIAGDSLSLEEVLKISDPAEFLGRFAGSPLMRAKREGLIRNAINAAVNSLQKDPQNLTPVLLPLLKEISLNDQSEKLRQIAAKALQKLSPDLT